MITAAAIRKLAEKGLSIEEIAEVAEAMEEPREERSARQDRNRRYYEAKRLKASEKRLNKTPEPSVLKTSESVLKRLNSDASRAATRVEDITLTSDGTGKKKDKNLVVDFEFEAAWKAYPHRKGRSSKPKSLIAWKALPSDHRPPLLDAIRRYAAEGYEPKADCGAKAFELWLKDQRYLDWMPEISAPVRIFTQTEKDEHDQHIAERGRLLAAQLAADRKLPGLASDGDGVWNPLRG